MKLGVYSRPENNSNDSDGVYVQRALYDFDTGEWDERSDGLFVSKASENPSPEELKVRFDMERRDTFVATPERLESNGHTVVVDDDPAMTVEEGHAEREERGGPLDTQAEKQHQKDEDVIVVPDDYEFRDEEPDNAVRESDWDGLDFTEAFAFDFYTPQTDDTDTDNSDDADSA